MGKGSFCGKLTITQGGEKKNPSPPYKKRGAQFFGPYHLTQKKIY